MEKKGWWYEQPLVISAIQVHVKKGSKAAFDEYVSKAGYNVEQLLHLFAPENDLMTYYEEEKHGAKLDDYLAYTEKAGIKKIVYTNTHGLSVAKSAENEKYRQIGKDGKPDYIYGIYNLACINPHGEFHKDVIKNIRGLCRHKIDGIFFDGPINRGCYCEVCQADFKKRYGHSIFEATPREFNEMRVDTLTEHLKEIYSVIKSINPEIAVYINNSALRPDVTGSNTRKVYDYVDMLGAEGGFYEPHYGIDSLWRTSAFMKRLESVIDDPLKERKPIVNFIAANDSGVSLQLKTAGETAITYAHTLANGANVWYGFHYDVFKGMNTPAAKKAEEYNKFILDHKDLFKASASCAKVALMWSENTANYYASSVSGSDFTDAKDTGFKERGDHRVALFAFVDMFERSHILFDIVDEKNIENGEIDKYDTLVLPTVACLSDENAERIKKFVKNGGTVLGNFDVASYNEYGVFAGESKLSEVFGFKGKPTLYSCSWGSIMFKAANHPALSYVDAPQHLACFLDLKREYEKDVNVLMTAHPPMDSVYSVMPEERYPAFTERKYGKGKAYYLSGTFGETLAKRKVNAYRKTIKGLIEYVSHPVVKCDEKGLYEVSLRRQEDRFLFHIVNMTGEMERPIEKVLSLDNLHFEIDLGGFGLDKNKYTLRAIRGGKLKNLKQSGSVVSFDLDKVDEYEIVVIE